LDELRLDERTRDQSEQANREAVARNRAEATDAASWQRTEEERHEHGGTEGTVREERKADIG